jgi:hypothetical protein
MARTENTERFFHGLHATLGASITTRDLRCRANVWRPFFLVLLLLTALCAASTPAFALLGSSTTVSSSGSPSLFGASVTFIATVTGLIIPPSGTVTFKDGGTSLGSGMVDGAGHATFTTNSLAVGSHSITAVYGGDLIYNASTSVALTQVVNQNTSTTAISAAPNPITFGTSVLFTANVTSPGGIPTGTVTFKDGTSTIGTGTLNGSGQATLSTAALSVGGHSISAVYGGDTGFAGSTSTVVTQTVNQASSATSLAASVNPAIFGASVTFTATVTSTGGTPGGTVTFMDGASTLGTGTLNGSGQATLSTATLASGNHSVTAVYGGDSNFAGSTSTVLTQTVNPTSSATGLVVSVNPATFGTSVTFTADVTGSGGNPGGTVTFIDGATTLGTGTLNGSGQATLSTAALAVGSHSITAMYGGDSNFVGSASSVLTLAVNQNSSTTALASSANPSAVGGTVTFTATITVSGSTATGIVTFKDGASTLGTSTLNGSGQATLSAAALGQGNHNITAVYGGDSNYTGSTSAVLTQTVNQNSSTTTVSTAPNPSTYGTSVTFTANVTGPGGTPTGTVTFKDGANPLGPGTLNGSGQATFSTSTLTSGNHSITAVYGGDGSFSSSTSSALTQTVNQTSSATSMTASVNPTTFGTSVTLTANVTGTGNTPGGSVTFKDGATTLGSGTLNGSGQATLTTSSILVGSHSITAVYGGDSNFLGSTSSILTLVVNQNSSTTALASSANPSAVGGPVIFTATVTSSGGIATGTVTFKDGAAMLGTGNLNGAGQATFTTSLLALGSHSISAVYGGGGNFTGSTSPVLIQTVNQNASTTTIAAAPNPSTFGSSVTFTGSVTGSGTLNGTVTFKDGATTLGSGTLNGSGQATLSTNSIAGGNHSITAVYSGDGNSSSSTSAVLTQTVNPTSSATSVTASINPSTFGVSVTFTADVTGTGGTPSGIVTFRDGAATLGGGTLNGSGQATFTTSSIAAGSHSITAVYGGDTSFSGSTSPTLTQVVNQNTSTTALASSANPSAVGGAVIFTATVTTSGGIATGMVTFKDGASTLGSGMLNGAGQATFTTSTLGQGNHSVTAIYGGDSSFTGSTSAVLTQTVNANSSTTTLASSANPAAFGAPVTFTATVTGSGATPTGMVTFKDGANSLGTGALNGSGQATFTISVLSAGVHSISTVYGGDSSYGSSISPTLAQTIGENASTTGLTSSSNPATSGTPVTLTATVGGAGGTPTGIVTFKDGAITLGTGTLNGSGQATLNVSSFAGGNHSLSAVYGGDGNFVASTSSILTLGVSQNSSVTGLIASSNPAAAGAAVSLTATVSGTSGTPTGTMIFKDGVTTLGTVVLNGSGQASMTVTLSGNGTHPITAVYSGDGSFTTSTSSVLNLTIVQNATVATLSSSLNPSSAGQTVTFTATIVVSGGSPTGTVVFRDGGSVIGSVALAGTTALLSISSLVSGTHNIVAAYSGDTNYAAATSAPLIQSVSVPADSLKLRALQIAGTRMAAQTSGAAISGAIDAAVSEGLADDGTMFTVNDSGIRFNSGGSQSANNRVKHGFSTNEDRRPRWLVWTDLRSNGSDIGAPNRDLSGHQINALAGITFRNTPNLVTGFLGGFESFNYTSETLNGHLHGDGWTVGAYMGWRLMPGLRFDAGLAYSGIDFDGTAGTASGSFPGHRTLVTAGLTGSYKITQPLEIEPSAHVYAIWEQEDGYTDSLGTAQLYRSFSNGRASAGAKLIYHSQWPDITVTPYVGLYADYYFTQDSADAAPLPLPSTDGASARLTSGITLATRQGTQFSLGGELGGLGSGNFDIWSVRARTAIAF